MTIAKLQYYRKRKGYSYKKIAELSGIPLSTVQKVLGGQTKVPRYETLQALEKVLVTEDDSGDYDTQTESQNMLREISTYGSSAEKNQMKYTLKDYYDYPEDKRVELIEGVFYDMSAPTTIHQVVGSEIWLQLKLYISQNNGQCIPFIAPTDVHVDVKDDTTMVQPDVLVVCDRNKITKACIEGAPDFVVEVVSGSTKKKDMTIKLAKYQTAGVKEYWIVDLEQRRIFSYVFDSEEFVSIYGIEEQIPVSIYQGDLKIDFKKINKMIEEIMNGNRQN